MTEKVTSNTVVEGFKLAVEPVTGEVIKIKYKKSKLGWVVVHHFEQTDNYLRKIGKDNVSQRKTAKNLGLSPSTVHNIVKIFRESRVQTAAEYT